MEYFLFDMLNYQVKILHEKLFFMYLEIKNVYTVMFNVYHYKIQLHNYSGRCIVKTSGKAIGF